MTVSGRTARSVSIRYSIQYKYSRVIEHMYSIISYHSKYASTYIWIQMKKEEEEEEDI